MSKEQLKFLKKHSHEIDPDFKFLEKELRGKRVVLLGEFTHGSKEINLLKNETVKYLHEQLGYKVLLFESGIGELLSIELNRTQSTPNELINMGLFGPWRTQEYLALMQYLKTHDQLQVAGFDVQRSGQAFGPHLQQIVDQIAPGSDIDILQLEKDYAAFLNFMRKNSFDQKMKDQQQAIVGRYQTVYQQIKNHQSPQTATTLKTIQNRIAHLDYYLQFKKDNYYTRRWSARDSIMADNIIWLLENVYPDEKVIINAHNYHISKYNEKLLTMGEVLAEKFQDEVYSIGIFGGQGEFANNARKPEKLTLPTEDNDIKHFIAASPWENTFISIAKSRKKGGSWLQKEVIVNDSFLDLSRGNKLVPGTCYDGLIFIKNISPPEYLY